MTNSREVVTLAGTENENSFTEIKAQLECEKNSNNARNKRHQDRGSGKQ